MEEGRQRLPLGAFRCTVVLHEQQFESCGSVAEKKHVFAFNRLVIKINEKNFMARLTSTSLREC